MGFKLPSMILQKVLGMRAIKHKNGKFLLWGIPCFVSPTYSFVYFQSLLENQNGKEKAADILYKVGKMQGEYTFKMISERFGYAKTIPEKQKLLEFNLGQGEVIGIGKFKWIRLDFKKNFFVLKGICSIGEEYRKFFGPQKEPVDHFIIGEAAAFLEQLTNKELFAVETKCIAKGNAYCEAVIKSIDQLTPVEKTRYLARKKLPSLKELGANIEPYLALYS